MKKGTKKGLYYNLPTLRTGDKVKIKTTGKTDVIIGVVPTRSGAFVELKKHKGFYNEKDLTKVNEQSNIKK